MALIFGIDLAQPHFADMQFRKQTRKIRFFFFQFCKKRKAKIVEHLYRDILNQYMTTLDHTDAVMEKLNTMGSVHLYQLVKRATHVLHRGLLIKGRHHKKTQNMDFFQRGLDPPLKYWIFEKKLFLIFFPHPRCTHMWSMMYQKVQKVQKQQTNTYLVKN